MVAGREWIARADLNFGGLNAEKLVRLCVDVEEELLPLVLVFLEVARQPALALGSVFCQVVFNEVFYVVFFDVKLDLKVIQIEFLVEQLVQLVGLLADFLCLVRLQEVIFVDDELSLNL